MAARTITAVMDRIDHEVEMAGMHGESVEDRYTLVVTDHAIHEVTLVKCRDRGEVQQVIDIINEDNSEQTISIDMADNELDALGIIQDRWEQADREMGDPYP